jgi:predicted negative regulator of RcsB-dependent stress response
MGNNDWEYGCVLITICVLGITALVGWFIWDIANKLIVCT